jgi:predicted nucleic acid-binding protein
LEDVDVHVALRCAHQAMSRLANPEDIAGVKERVEIVLFGSDVTDGDHDVDDGLCCKTGNRRRADVLDVEVHRCESISDAHPLFEVDRWPSIVVGVELNLERLATTHNVDDLGIGSARLRASTHTMIIASGLKLRRTVQRNLEFCRRQSRTDLPHLTGSICIFRHARRLHAPRISLRDHRRKELFKAAAEEIFSSFEDFVLPFDRAAAIHYATVVSARDRAGLPIDGFDAQIAAICRTHKAVLATRNVKDFQGTGIEITDPWQLN